MPAFSNNIARVRELTQRAADGVNDEASVAELDGLLRDDAAARRTYLRMMDLHFDLERKAARGTLTANHAGAEVIVFPTVRRPRVTRLRTLAAAAAVILAAIGAWWTVRPGKCVATIIKGAGEVWQGRDAHDRGVMDGKELSLVSGLVEVETSLGVRFVCEGPLRARFDGPQRLRLLSGKLYAEVPERAHGFTVVTPAGRVVDLGTRFAIEVTGGHADGIQVYEGRVIAKLDGGANSRGSELTAGEAARMDSAAQVIKPAPFDDDRFTQVIGPFYESFQAREKARPFAGHRGWFESNTGETASHAHVSHRGLSYPGLAHAQADSLEIWPKQRTFTPLGHRWPFPFASAILQLDDDLVKQLRHRPDIENVTLLTRGASSVSEPGRVRLVVRADPNAGRGQCRLGLASGGAATYTADSYHQTQVFFAVIQVDGSVARLWVNPDSATFASAAPPPPDVTLPLPAAEPAKVLWIGQSDNPTYIYWWLDELRGGHSWAEVTPPIE